MGLTRQQVSQIYRPVGPKLITAGLAATSGATLSVIQAVDLSLPIGGFRLVLKGRLVIGGADMATVNPEGILNFLKNIRVTGTNSRQKGNVTLWDLDLATIWTMQHLFTPNRSGQFDQNNGTGGAIEQPVPTTPFSPYIVVTQGTYDFRIVVDLPAWPFGVPVGQRPGFMLRQNEWKDTLQLQFAFATVANAAVAGPFGTGAAGTTLALSQFGAGGGNPTLDVYSLPMIMGPDLAPSVVPGFVTRVQQPLTTAIQTAGTNTVLQVLQKQPTTRIFIKVGVSTAAPAFSSLSDTNISQLGITLGGNRNVRDLLDVFAHKQMIVNRYGSNPIQGYNCFDFIDSGNSDSSYPGDLVGEGTTFQLVATLAGISNGLAIVVQEQTLYRPEGPLYTTGG